MTTENLVPVEFNFSASNQKLKCISINKEPWFVAKEVCDILGLKNVTMVTATLDADEKSELSLTYTSSNGTTQKRKTKIVNESGLYALILNSRKKEARVFRKWITSDVLPSIRKKGYYGNAYLPSTFTDVRDMPYTKVNYNNATIRMLQLENEVWYSLTDIHRAIGSATCTTQASKKLNTKKTLAQKFWIFGATHPSWFTTELGFRLIIGASKIAKTTTQITLGL